MTGTVLIVDDDPDFARAASELLSDRGYTIVGHAANTQEALRWVDELSPDAVLLDVKLPDGDGVALAAALCSGQADLIVLITSSDRWAVTGKLLRSSGARGFVPKSELATTDLDQYLKD